jgi:tetratricopeptide (TPR) repeat protein
MPEAAPMSHLTLPDAPADAWQNGVAVWSQPLVIDSYLPEMPDAYPAFLDRRVYQGSSGRVYPLPFHDRIAARKTPHEWQAVHLENEWLRVVVLPELGGRVHIVYDKVAGYDIFYRNNVIKPALVGLAGPWVSGGIEFNWPQHHRPATFLPTDVEIRRDADGSATVWCSDHDPFARMKGMHGIRLTPSSSRLEVHVRLYNRSEVPQTFLWWANVAAAVNDDYQSFFPPDVTRVADHAKRAIVSFPHPDAPYYGIDYAARAAAQRPDGDRLDWYRNIPVPTSYMALDSTDDFFGGYDHGRDAGFVHVAPHEISPGKKQWTWGNAPFGWAWDRNLTDGDGPYVELMAGVYTDNQPDFAFLAAGETKTFHQAWFPIRQTGPVQFANEQLALSTAPANDGLQVFVCAAVRAEGAVVRISGPRGVVLEESVDLDPAHTLRLDVADLAPDEVVVLITAGDAILARYAPGEATDSDAATRTVTAVAPSKPHEVPAIDELVQIGTYLDQYRHATRSSEPYFEEALRRDPEESRALLALGAKAYQRAEYERAALLLSRSAARGTKWTSTPASGEAHYRLGLALVRLGRLGEAATALARAMWDARYAVAARFALARLRSRQGRLDEAEALLRDALVIDPRHLQSTDLLAVILAERGDVAGARELARGNLALDPLDAWARHLLGEDPTGDATTMLDVALEYAAAGFQARAQDALAQAAALAPHLAPGQVNVGPLIALHQAALALAADDDDGLRDGLTAAAAADFTAAHPSRLDDVDALTAVAEASGAGLPSALLGHWYYDRGRFDAATEAWQTALRQGVPAGLAAVLHRNLGLAAYNVHGDLGAAQAHYRHALELDPESAKLLFENDQLAARAGTPAQTRLEALEGRRELVGTRDDLMIAFANLLIDVGRLSESRALLTGRAFQPWEGGEGQVLATWDRVGLAIAAQLAESGRAQDALAVLRETLTPPENLGEDRHALANTAELHLALGDALSAVGDDDGAAAAWEHAAASVGDFVAMSPTPYSENTVFAASALRRVGREGAARALVDDMSAWLDGYAVAEVEVDFFATSLPSMLLFVEDPAVARDRSVAVMRQQLADWRQDAASAQLGSVRE